MCLLLFVALTVASSVGCRCEVTRFITKSVVCVCVCLFVCVCVCLLLLCVASVGCRCEVIRFTAKSVCVCVCALCLRVFVCLSVCVCLSAEQGNGYNGSAQACELAQLVHACVSLCVHVCACMCVHVPLSSCLIVVVGCACWLFSSLPAAVQVLTKLLLLSLYHLW